MRTLILTCLVLTAGAWVPLAAQQQPPQAPPGQQPQAPDPTLTQQLNVILGVWQNMIPNTDTVYVEFKASRKYNAVNGNTKRFHGQAKFMRLPGGLIGALVFLQEIDQNNQPILNKYELVICTGEDIYFVDPAAKEVYYQSLPKNRIGQVPDQGPLTFLFGMKKVPPELSDIGGPLS